MCLKVFINIEGNSAFLTNLRKIMVKVSVSLHKSNNNKHDQKKNYSQKPYTNIEKK